MDAAALAYPYIFCWRYPLPPASIQATGGKSLTPRRKIPHAVLLPQGRSSPPLFTLPIADLNKYRSLPAEAPWLTAGGTPFPTKLQSLDR